MTTATCSAVNPAFLGYADPRIQAKRH